MLDAADEVDRQSRLAQCPDDADVREPARAAAGQHESDGLAGQHARDARHVRRVHRRDGGRLPAAAPSSGRQHRGTTLPSLSRTSSARAAALRCASPGITGHGCAGASARASSSPASACTHAQLGPGRRLRVRHVDDKIVGALDPMEPGARMIGAADAPDELGAAQPAERRDQLGGEAAGIDLDALRQQCVGARAATGRAGGAIGRPETLDHELRDPGASRSDAARSRDRRIRAAGAQGRCRAARGWWRCARGPTAGPARPRSGRPARATAADHSRRPRRRRGSRRSRCTWRRIARRTRTGLPPPGSNSHSSSPAIAASVSRSRPRKISSAPSSATGSRTTWVSLRSPSIHTPGRSRLH